MKIKLDENLGKRSRQLFADAGHDVATIPEQGLCGTRDDSLIETCQIEQRCLVMLDLGFANPLIFPPQNYRGIVVLRLPRRPAPGHLIAALRTLIRQLSHKSIIGKLWIVEAGRIREYVPEEGGMSD